MLNSIVLSNYLDKLCDFINKTVHFVDFATIYFLSAKKYTLIPENWCKEYFAQNLSTLLFHTSSNCDQVYNEIINFNSLQQNVEYFFKTLPVVINKNVEIRECSSKLKMNKKLNKNIQLEHFGLLLLQLFTANHIERVVDVGCGLGHLLGWLSKHCTIELVGVDAEEQFCNKGRLLYPTIDLQCLRIDSVESLKRVALKPNKRTALVSLHGCGDVQELILRAYSEFDAAYVPLLVTIGCCYHKVTRPENNQWILSEAVRQRLKVVVNRAALRNACDCDMVMFKARSTQEHCTRLFSCLSRAVVELFYEEMGLDMSAEPRKKRRHLGNTLEEVKFELITRHKVVEEDKKQWMDKFDEIVCKMQPQFRCLEPFLFVRQLLQGPFERLVLLDRMMFLREKIIDAYLSEVFPSAVTPRNFCLVAKR